MKQPAQPNEEKPRLKTGHKAAIIAASALIGGFLSRWHGGGFISGSPKLLKAFLWSAPFALVSGYALYADDRSWELTGGLTALVLGGCMLFKNTGHGGGMDLATSPKEPNGNPSREPEKLEYTILWLHGKMPQYWYDALLLCIIGTASTFIPAAVIGITDPLSGIVTLLGGMLGKPLGYMIGHALKDTGLIDDLPYDLNHATAIGELISGLGAYTGLSLAFIHIHTGA